MTTPAARRRVVEFCENVVPAHVGVHAFSVQLAHDGTIFFTPSTDAPEALAQRIEWFCSWVLEHPGLAEALADVAGARRAVFEGYADEHHDAAP